MRSPFTFPPLRKRLRRVSCRVFARSLCRCWSTGFWPPDALVPRELANRIGAGNFPTWRCAIQVMPEADAAHYAGNVRTNDTNREQDHDSDDDGNHRRPEHRTRHAGASTCVDVAQDGRLRDRCEWFCGDRRAGVAARFRWLNTGLFVQLPRTCQSTQHRCDGKVKASRRRVPVGMTA
ncbi:catalase [Burkholderia sp. Ax-1724]|nr:catalase [Burkholderia sp. Ax-1724]